MTLYERQVVSAYTGVLMCSFYDYHEYIEKVLGRPVFTHEFLSPMGQMLEQEIKQKVKPEFLALCKED